MRNAWSFYAGIIVAGLILLYTTPVLVAAALGYAALRGWTTDHGLTMAGVSAVTVQQDQGRLSARLLNHSYRVVAVPQPGERRLRRLLLRQEVSSGEAYASRTEDSVRLDAWVFDTPEDLRKPPLYQIFSPGSGAFVEDDSVFWVERGSRRVAYSLINGDWLLESDAPAVSFTIAGEQRRFFAVAITDEDLPPRSVAMISYASAEKNLGRYALVADDPLRARMLRSTVAVARPMSRVDETGRRLLELPLASGMVRLPLKDGMPDPGAAQLPAGLTLSPIRTWE